jgi:hypothetical protein
MTYNNVLTPRKYLDAEYASHIGGNLAEKECACLIDRDLWFLCFN